MAVVMRAQDPMVSLCDPSTQHPDSNASFLSFSALADCETGQDERPRYFHNNSWPGAQNWKMGDAPAYQSMEALEATDINDFYSLDSPQSLFAITPNELPTQSYLGCDAGTIAPQTFAPEPLLQGHIAYGEPTTDHDDRHIFSSGGYSSMSHQSKASHASFATSVSGNSEYLMTPRHSVASNPRNWGSMSLPSGSPSHYPEQWAPQLMDKPGPQQPSPSVWGTEYVGDELPVADYINYQGEVDNGFYAGDFQPPQLSYRGSLSSNRQSGSLPPVSNRDLSTTFGVSLNEDAARSESGMYSPQPALLPPASIVGNVLGWQSSSPTYPSLLDYEEAAAGRTDFEAYGHFGEPISYPAVPRSSNAGLVRPGSAYLSVPHGTASSRSRSLDVSTRQTTGRLKNLFAFHPAAEDPNLGYSPYDPIDAAAQQYPMQVISSGLSSRRNTRGLEVQIPHTPVAGPHGLRRTSTAPYQPNRLPKPVAVRPITPAASYSPHSAPHFGAAIPQYTYNDPAVTTPSPAAPSVQPSVLASAPGGIHIAPPLSATAASPTTPISAMEPLRPRTCPGPARIAPPPILTSEPLSAPELTAVVGPSLDVDVRPIAKLPATRKASSAKSRKPSAAKRKVSDNAISFGDFINYTPKDAAVISAGVAPSGSKPKRRSEDEGDQSSKRIRTAESA